MNLQENVSECNGKIKNISLKSKILNNKASYSTANVLIFNAFVGYFRIYISVKNIINRMLFASFVKREVWLIINNIQKIATLAKFQINK